jgi:hypothetical protein
VKKLDGMAKNSQSQKAYKSKIEDMVQPLGKEISKTAGNILHQIIEDTTSVKNVKNRTNKLPGGRSGDILTFLKSILSHVLKIISDDTINAEIAKAAYNKFIDWINLHKSYDFIEPEDTIFKKMFKSLAKFVSGKAVETEENNNIVEIEKEIKNTIFKFFLNMVFGNEKEGHKYINKYFIKLIMSFDIVQWFIKPIAANNKMSLFKKEDVEDLFKPLIEIVKVELYSNLCDEQIKNEQKDRLENIKNKTKDVFEKLQKNIDLIQTSTNKYQSEVKEKQSQIASATTGDMDIVDKVSTFIDHCIEFLILFLETNLQYVLDEIKSWNDTKKRKEETADEIKKKSYQVDQLYGLRQVFLV